jgi:threonine dehydrogenase-like Zn-dependent dehydrogenase
MSEFITHPETLLHKKPDGMPWEHAACVEPLTIATHGVHRVKAKAGEYGAVVGAGTIGILTALYLKHIGAIPILIDILDSRLEIARDLGIEHTILSDGAAPVEEINRITGGRGAETVFEISGSLNGVTSTLYLASYVGRISLTGWPGSAPQLETALITRRELVISGSRNSVDEFPEGIDLIYKNIIPADKIITNIIDFTDLPDAIRKIAANPEKTLKSIALLPRQ